MSAASAGAAIATDAENRILHLNPAARELLGFDSRKAEGRNLHDLLRAQSGETDAYRPKWWTWVGTVYVAAVLLLAACSVLAADR